MYYRRLVEDAYHEAIALMPDIPLDLRSALKKHGKIPLMIHNLALELDKVQASQQSKGKQVYAVKQLKEIVYDFTKLFIEGVKMEAEQRYQSDVKKQLLEAEARKAKDLDDTASGKVSGEFADIFKEGGVIATNDRSVL